MKKITAIMIAASLLLSAFTPVFAEVEAENLNDRLIMHYTFDEEFKDNVIKNASSKGSEYDAVSANVSEEYGIARFPFGESYFILPNHYATEFTENYTVAMWVKVDSQFANSDAGIHLFNLGGNYSYSQQLQYNPYKGEMYFMDRGQAMGAYDWALTADVGAIAGKWTHIALVYEFVNYNPCATASLFVNGVKVGESIPYYQLFNSLADCVGKTTGKGFFGRSQWGNNNVPDFMGKMDDIRIYNRAVSAEEISTLYNNMKPSSLRDVTVSFVDTDGNKIKDDICYSSDVGDVFTVQQAITASFTTVTDEGQQVNYIYNSAASNNSVVVSAEGDNKCTLVYYPVVIKESENLLVNPSFEINTDGWTNNVTGVLVDLNGWERSSDVAHEGEYSLKMTESQGSGSSFGTYIPIESGKIYKLSYWEYSENAYQAGNHLMSAACIAAENSALNGDSNNHLIEECGGHSSWYNEINGISPRDLELKALWNKREYVFDTRNVPNANYILISYAWGEANSFYIDDFYLSELTEKAFGVGDVSKERVSLTLVGEEKDGIVCAMLMNNDEVQEVAFAKANDVVDLIFKNGRYGNVVKLFWWEDLTTMKPVIEDVMIPVR